ncbi:MAG TPA: hypothetical protein VJB13_01945 [Candidatus Nanoarchaeia archaeon]|nr:hypothetical protein [Candidatus Nanoarchaeia archaeon]
MADRNYLTFAHHKYLFDLGYTLLQQNPVDREVLTTTFEQGVLALSALQDLRREDADLSRKVYQLSQQRKYLAKI